MFFSLRRYGLTGKTAAKILKNRKCSDESEKAIHLCYGVTVAFESNRATLSTM